MIATYVGFEDDSLVIRATAVGTENIVFHANNSNIPFDYVVEDIVLDESNGFELKISLAELEKAKAGEYLNLRVSVDGDSSLKGITNNNVDLSVTHTYNGNTYKLGLNGSTVYVSYSAANV